MRLGLGGLEKGVVTVCVRGGQIGIGCPDVPEIVDKG